MKKYNLILLIFIITLSMQGCISQRDMSGYYSIQSGYAAAILKIDSSRVVFIPYFTVGEGYSIHLGKYNVRGRKIIFLLDDYFLHAGNPTRWEKGSKSRKKYHISPEGDLINVKSPNYSFLKDDHLSEEERELLETAPTWVKKYPYPYQD